MVAAFFYADYGWLRSPDGKEKAWAPFRVGKRHDCYFDNENIHTQAACVMGILRAHYLHDDHILIFYNTIIHLKRTDGSLSESKVLKGISEKLMVDINVVDEKLFIRPMERY